jgi:serine/threonine protein kinase
VSLRARRPATSRSARHSELAPHDANREQLLRHARLHGAGADAPGRRTNLGYHTDIYLLGAILFELVSGRSPHWQDNAQTAFYMAMKNELHPLPEHAPAELRELLDAALATHPSGRPRTAELFRESLEDYPERRHPPPRIARLGARSRDPRGERNGARLSRPD